MEKRSRSSTRIFAKVLQRCKIPPEPALDFVTSASFTGAMMNILADTFVRVAASPDDAYRCSIKLKVYCSSFLLCSRTQSLDESHGSQLVFDPWPRCLVARDVKPCSCCFAEVFSMEARRFTDGLWSRHSPSSSHPCGPLLKQRQDTIAMQAATGTNTLASADIFMEDPEREGCDMEVELGVNLVDAFTKKHTRWKAQHTKTPTPTPWRCIVTPLVPDTEMCGLLPAGSNRDGECFSSDLDEVAQEVLTKALLEDQDVALMEVNGDLESEASSSTRKKLEMVVFLYAFEKFRFVYA